MGATVRWNRFGTPHVVANPGGFVAEGLSADPVQAAREWIVSRSDLFGLSAEAVAALEVVRVAPIGAGRAVMLRQRFGGLPSGIDGTVDVAVIEGNVAYVSSSLTRDTTLAGEVRLTAEEAVGAAAADIGQSVGASAVVASADGAEWTVLDVEGLDQPVHARLVAVPTPLDGVRPAWETVVLDPAASEGFSHLVDAETGEVLVRTDLVDHAQADQSRPATRTRSRRRSATTSTRPSPTCS
jgi:hypothetical protein